MIEERAVVKSVSDGQIHVQVVNVGNCPKCAEGNGCGGGLIGRLAGHQRHSVQVTSRVPNLVPGDRVVVGVDPGAVLSASLVVYLLPIIGMVGLGAFAHGPLQGTDLLVTAFGVTGLGAGLMAVRWQSGRMDISRYRPEVLRRDTTSADACPRLTG